MPLVPVEALIPYIYVLPNNSFIDFIKKEREKKRKGEGGGREKRERGRERKPRAFTVYLHPRSFVPASWHPFIFFCIEESVWVSSRFKRTGPTQSLPEQGDVRINGGIFNLGIYTSSFPPSPCTYERRRWYIPSRERVYK